MDVLALACSGTVTVNTAPPPCALSTVIVPPSLRRVDRQPTVQHQNRSGSLRSNGALEAAEDAARLSPGMPGPWSRTRYSDGLAKSLGPHFDRLGDRHI